MSAPYALYSTQRPTYCPMDAPSSSISTKRHPPTSITLLVAHSTPLASSLRPIVPTRHMRVQYAKAQRSRFYQGTAGGVADAKLEKNMETYDVKSLVPPFSLHPRGLSKWFYGFYKSAVSYLLIALKMRQQKEKFSLKLFKKEAIHCYKELYEALAKHDTMGLKRVVSEGMITELKKKMVDKGKEADWSVEELNPKVLAIRYAAIQGPASSAKRREFGQLTVQFNTKQKLVIRDKSGNVVAGKDEPVEVNEIWVFERDMQEEGLWKVVAKLKT